MVSKKQKSVIALFFVIILLLAGLPFLIWSFKDSQTLNVIVLDNTVPDNSYREHKGLFWILNSQKYVHETEGMYDASMDYYGFFPFPDYKYEIRKLPDTIENTDLIYLADTYGVYEKEFYGENPEGLRSKIIYGGLNSGELNKIEAAVRNGVSLVAEFNTFGSPTTGAVRERLYDLLHVEWTGWIGRYFLDLTRGVEVPLWAVMNYEAQHGVEWDFHGPGILFADENDQIVVLLEGEGVTSDNCKIEFTTIGKEFFNISEKIQYNYWFDIITLDEECEPYALFSLALTNEGKEQLSAYDIPQEFPAVVKYCGNDYLSYYFAGDFVDIDTIPKYYQYYGYDALQALITSDTGSYENRGFYWKFYVPMIKTILKEVYVETLDNV
ncbi:MAG: hypothetical protein ACXQS3_01910 [Candidatus Methanofastidiosia archaeon]